MIDESLSSVKTENHIISSESYDYQGSQDCNESALVDLNNLLEAYYKSRKGSRWKHQVQQFELHLFSNLMSIHNDLMEDVYQFSPTNEFVLNERGHIRFVTASHVRDRVTTHVLCDEVLNPTLLKYLIYDNGASQTGKGIDFSRRRLMTHLHRYYNHYGTNEGYILLMDFSKYYDNIWHSILLDRFKTYITDPVALKYIEQLLHREEIDVSYMDDSEYAICMTELFNSIDYQSIDRSLRTGEKMMAKHLEIGDQLSQIAALIYPIPFDNFVKIVKGNKFYARYMDDSYVLHPDKLYLKELLAEMIEQATNLGIRVNEKKTHITKLSDHWRFLQIRYCLTDTGKVYTQINPKRIHAMRRKLKALARQIEPSEFENLYKSWICAHRKYMSAIQIQQMDQLYSELMEVCKEWSRLLLQMEPSSTTSRLTATTTFPLSRSVKQPLLMASPKWSFQTTNRKPRIMT